MPDKDMLLLDPATGKPACRKEVSTLVDQSSIIGNSDAATPFRVNYPVVAGALAGSGVAANAGKLDAALVHAPGSASSGAGTTSSPLNVPAPPTVPVATDSVQGIVELTGSAQMPAEKTRDDSALTPAGAAKLVSYIKPVASTGALNAAQQSADAIELPMFSNFSCTGGTKGAPKWTIHKEGGGTCDIDLGAYGGGGDGSPPTHAPGTVLVDNMCVDSFFDVGYASAVVAAKGKYTGNSRYKIEQILGSMPNGSINGLPYYGGMSTSANQPMCSNRYTMGISKDSEGRLVAMASLVGNDTGGSCVPQACVRVTYLGEDA